MNQTPTSVPSTEHSGKKYFWAAVGLIVEIIALVYGVWGLGVLAAALFWLAFYEYTKNWFSTKQPLFRNTVLALTLVVLVLLLVGGAVIVKHYRERVTLKVTPHVVVFRPPPRKGWTLVTQYGLSAVFYAHNATPSPKQIQSLEVFGDVEVTWVDYTSSIKWDGTISDESVYAEYKRLRPYRRLHWIAYPMGDGRIDGNGGEKFIKFRFIDPTRPGMRGFQGTPADYFGSRTDNTETKVLTTSVHLEDLITFTRLTEGNPKEWIGPRLREELNGRPFFRVIVDGVTMTIDRQNVNPVQSTLEKNWKEGNPADLFHGKSGTIWDGISPRRTFR